MPKLDIGSYYWYISAEDYIKLGNLCTPESGYTINQFGFDLYVSENDFDSSYVGYYAVRGAIDDEEMEFLDSLGLDSFDSRQIMISVQANSL